MEQKLIRTGEMTVEVESVERALREVQAIAASRDGLLADAESEMDDAGNRRAVVRVRVPSVNFEDAVRELRKLGTVERERIATEDVTKAYADLETRLSAKRKTEERLRDLLSSRTGDLAEVLQVERELSRLIGEIEQLEGERRYYDRRIAISTIKMDLYESGAAIRPGVLAPVGDALSASISILAFSAAAVIYVVVFLAPWVLVGLPIFWVARKVKRRGRSETISEP